MWCFSASSRAASAARTSATSSPDFGAAATSLIGPWGGGARTGRAAAFVGAADGATAPALADPAAGAPAARAGGVAGAGDSATRADVVTGAGATFARAAGIAGAGAIAVRTVAAAKPAVDGRCSTRARMPSLPSRRCIAAAGEMAGTLRGAGVALSVAGAAFTTWRSNRTRQLAGCPCRLTRRRQCWLPGRQGRQRSLPARRGRRCSLEARPRGRRNRCPIAATSPIEVCSLS